MIHWASHCLVMSLLEFRGKLGKGLFLGGLQMYRWSFLDLYKGQEDFFGHILWILIEKWNLKRAEDTSKLCIRGCVKDINTYGDCHPKAIPNITENLWTRCVHKFLQTFTLCISFYFVCTCVWYAQYSYQLKRLGTSSYTMLIMGEK